MQHLWDVLFTAWICHFTWCIWYHDCNATGWKRKPYQIVSKGTKGTWRRRSWWWGRWNMSFVFMWPGCGLGKFVALSALFVVLFLCFCCVYVHFTCYLFQGMMQPGIPFTKQWPIGMTDTTHDTIQDFKPKKPKLIKEPCRSSNGCFLRGNHSGTMGQGVTFDNKIVARRRA